MIESELNMMVGRNVRKYRLIHDRTKGRLTQKMLADMIGVKVSTIGNLESERSSMGISIYNLYKISKVLNVSIEKFFM